MAKPKARYRFSTADKIIGVQTALASDRTPKQLKPGLRRYLRTLKASKEGKGFLKSIFG
jgi:hypothetical protein